MVTVGVSIGLTVIVKILLITVAGRGQVALEVISTFIWLLLTSALVVNVSLFVPTGMPATYHWYVGVLPPFIGVAVNVTEVPVHIGLTGLARIDTDGVIPGLIFTVAMLVSLVQGAIPVIVYVKVLEIAPLEGI
jgi:hypothetical protein